MPKTTYVVKQVLCYHFACGVALCNMTNSKLCNRRFYVQESLINLRAASLSASTLEALLKISNICSCQRVLFSM